LVKTAYLSRNYLNREGRFAHSAARGVLLSHLVGICFFLTILLSPAFDKQVLFTPILQWPIRALGLWLIVDRFGKQKSNKVSPWDWAHICFVAAYGCALIFAELYMTRDTGLTNYIQWANQTLGAYIYFLVLRECLTRRGFRADIVIRWVLATLVIACLIGICQAKDIGGLRYQIDSFYHQAQAEMYMEGPSMYWQARAPETHSNSLAIVLVCGLPLLMALNDFRKLRWFDWLSGALMITTIFMTYSRIGIVSLAAVGIGMIVVLLVRKEYYKAGVGIFVFTGMLVAFVGIVLAFDIQRFKVLLSNPNPIAANADETAGWRLRESSLGRAMALAEQYPFMGINAASGANNQQAVFVRNSYTFSGLLLNVYAFSFVSYGLVGVAYISALFWLILKNAGSMRSKQAFPASMFVLGLALAAAGIAENVLFFDQAMIITNIMMAFCVMKVARAQEDPRSSPQFQPAELPAPAPRIAKAL
jgi:hypothetical protein